MMTHEHPLVLGRDASGGVVEAVGQGVTDIAVGDEVLGHVLLVPPIQAGTLAEYAVLPAATVVKEPAGLDHVTVAALPLAGAAAAQSVDAVSPQSGRQLEAGGTELLGGIARFPDHQYAWRHVRGVDGKVYGNRRGQAAARGATAAPPPGALMSDDVRQPAQGRLRRTA